MARSIHEVAKEGDLETVKALLKENPELVFSKDNDGATPLHLAAESGNTGVAQLLLANGAEIDDTDINACTPLHRAATNGHKCAFR